MNPNTGAYRVGLTVPPLTEGLGFRSDIWDDAGGVLRRGELRRLDNSHNLTPLTTGA